MRYFTKIQIDGAREHFIKEGFPIINANIGSISFDYFLLPQSLNPDLPDFVLAMKGKYEGDGELYGVSDSMPEDLQPYAVFHDVAETKIIGNVPNRCLIALQYELLYVPTSIRDIHIKRRLDFFRKFLAYAEANPKDFDAPQVREFKQTLGRLEKIALKVN